MDNLDYYKLDLNRMSNLNPIDIDQKSVDVLKGMISNQFVISLHRMLLTSESDMNTCDRNTRVNVVKMLPTSFSGSKWTYFKWTQVVQCEDEWYQVYLLNGSEVEYYECDQIEGLKSLFRDLSLK